jgi:outer membrane autotransporter protein
MGKCTFLPYQFKENNMLIKSVRSHFPSFTVVVTASLFGAGGAFGATPVEEMSSAVETLCPQLKGANGLSRSEQDVLARCGELKQTKGQSFSNLSSAQLNGLSNMTSDESSSMGTSSLQMNSIQTAGVLTRIKTLRSKSGGSLATYMPSYPIHYNTVQPQTIPVDGMADDSSDSTLEWSANELSQESIWSFSNMADTSKWGVFANGSFSTGDRDTTDQEPGFDLTSWNFLLGSDYRLNNNFIVGGAFSYAASEAEINDNAGDIDLDGYGASLFATYFMNSLYFDIIGSYSRGEFDTLRNVNYSVPSTGGGTTTVNQQFGANSDTDDIQLSAGAGYDYTFGGSLLSPFTRLSYMRSDIDGYTEQLQDENASPGFGLALSVDDQEVTSLKTNLGIQISHAFSTSKGVITPYINMDWEHEFDNDARVITAKFAEVSSAFDTFNTISIVTEDPDRDYANLGLGVATVLPGGVQIFCDYSTILFHDYASLHTVVAGVRFEF